MIKRKTCKTIACKITIMKIIIILYVVVSVYKLSMYLNMNINAVGRTKYYSKVGVSVHK